MSATKFTSFNCRGIGEFKKRKDVFAYLHKQDFNVCFLQDIHCKKVGVPYFRNTWGKDVLIAPYTGNARGVAILTKQTDIAFSKTLVDNNGNYIITKANLSDSQSFCLVNVYGPNLDDPNFYEKLFEEISLTVGEEDMPIIIGGDLNLTLDQKLDNFTIIEGRTTPEQERF